MPTTFTDTLPSGGRLTVQNDSVVSNNGRYHLIMQADSHLVLYDTNIAPLGDPQGAIWHQNDAGTAAQYCEMQVDGNFVLYGFGLEGQVPVLWASGSGGHPGSYLRVQDDGNLVIYQPNFPIWDRFGRRGGFI